MSNKKIEYIIVHCSDSSWGSAREIRKWHTDAPPKGNGWRDLGYHFVINNGKPYSDSYFKFMDGQIEYGRDLDDDPYIEDKEVGAHSLGYNAKSIGICLIGRGKDDFTKEQYDSFFDVIIAIMDRYDIPIENVLGHYETQLANGKTCPNMDMTSIREIIKHEIDIRRRKNV
ncbi:MAG: N-acetylmuramoyl-L-alanine amidase [Candidatus Peribacteraceae bacterium]|nr:N-acetylmuramoyl-L-alanine amidase [Candidatus Peribacteraceae bacterium]